MAARDIYQCQHCGAQSAKWSGQCHQCKQWNTWQVRAAEPSGYAGEQSQMTTLPAVDLNDQRRLSTSLPELDRVLGGGLVASMVILIGGEPGIGKSTLLLQVCVHLAQTHPVLYVTGEESLSQVAGRAQRLGLACSDAVHLLAETQWEQLLSQAQALQPKAVVIDSIQVMHSGQIDAIPGSPTQMREVTARMIRWAKRSGVMLWIVGHVTKEGVLAGPKMLEHMVDTVLYFEHADDQRFRLLRASKNRFGAVNELGIFAMTAQGLKHLSHPSRLFISQSTAPMPGRAITVTMEGSRTLLVEIQALVDNSALNHPKRVTLGYDHNRLALLMAVLHKHAQVISYDKDIFVNVVGGMAISETSADLAMAWALLSSLYQAVLPCDLVILGEVGLTGEIRPVPYGVERAKAALQHGFAQAILPTLNARHGLPEGLTVHAVSTLKEAVTLFHELKQPCTSDSKT